ncbi:P-loop containing nucleoside triphosphate hydrolase protein [Pisolithus marmoratus]|nr:P-loop containing nucleoside triphosphate hydrolase protein [Pisolithus marmoratus]
MVAYNIIFAGETGAGKSSLINLLFDLEVSQTSNDILGLTGERKRFVTLQDSDVYRLWDTPGFKEGPRGSVHLRQPTKELGTLVKELQSGDGVHLVVFCFRFTKLFTAGLQRVYESVLSSIRDTQVPIVAAVTHADEMRQNPEDWWNGTEIQREQKGMGFRSYACVSTLGDEDYPPTRGRRAKAKDSVWQLIKMHAKALPLSDSLPKEINIILFGQTGAGKSSVVNLIAGKPIADVGADVERCTMSSTEYQFAVGAHDFRIWDTVGLEEPVVGINTYFNAILEALDLIRQVTTFGGVNLLLFCMPGRRITRTTQSNYRLFYEMLCEKKVPIGLVITHLEREKDMEGWWTRNERALDDFGIKNVGHACVTGLPLSPEQRALSKAAICGLLTDCDWYGKYTMPPDVWIKKLAKNMKSFLTAEHLPKGQKLTQALVSRVGLKEEDARQLRKYLEEPSEYEDVLP